MTGKARGGNQVHFVVNGKRYSLHSFWDSTILDMFIQDTLSKGSRNVKGAIEYFVTQVQSETSAASSAIEEGQTFQTTLLRWANEISGENCMLLWRYDEISEGEYLQRSKLLVRQLIIKAVQRSVFIFNRIFNCEKPMLLVQSFQS
jgi:hypothetical protein